jgi:deoxyuridine 5''-triphosphate nucleotidohydrolase (dut)
MNNLKVYFKKADSAMDLPLPRYMSLQAAGMDLYANVQDNIIIKPDKRAIIPTGIMIALPEGLEAQVRPRSGLAFKYGITVLNSPGTVDADYRGEICIVLINFGEGDFVVKRGDRVAQLVINRIEQIEPVEVEELPDSERGSRGFGSTGI